MHVTENILNIKSKRSLFDQMQHKMWLLQCMVYPLQLEDLLDSGHSVFFPHGPHYHYRKNCLRYQSPGKQHCMSIHKYDQYLKSFKNINICQFGIHGWLEFGHNCYSPWQLFPVNQQVAHIFFYYWIHLTIQSD